MSTSSSLHLRFSDAIDVATLAEIHLTCQTAGSESEVKIRSSTDLTGASITISPEQFLEPDQLYRLVASTGLRARDGSAVDPFQIVFRTTAATESTGGGLDFIAEPFDSTRSMTTVVVGPDRRLYAASAFGEILCWDLDAEGRPSNRRVLFHDPTTSRQFIDLEFHPASTAENLELWVSYAERLSDPADPRHHFSGQIARLKIRGDQIIDYQVVVKGLPHGREVQGGHETLPHQPNGLCFVDGMLYQSVGSTSSSGGPPNWGIPEQPLSACILEIDYQKIGGETVDVYPGGERYDPDASGAVVKRFATGIRNALEIIAHSNGRLYTAVNINDRGKRSDGVPDDPELPGDQNELIKQVTPDHESLYILQRGRHYGFPNPSIGNYVLAGGNPTNGEDPFEITDYPVGTKPEAGFAPELMYPIWQWGGTSPNGMIEYRPTFKHPLKTRILCCFYSAGDIAAIALGADGLPERIDKLRSPTGKLQLRGPLDITQDESTGSLYIADFGTQSKFGDNGSLVWLRRVESLESH
ncbi:Ig-like domain-containing protein [Stieleria sp. TO1_6]|nr:Ig-like domain-containing protein [Stieleria tagensis]